MNIKIQFIAHKNHRHTTLGYWKVENGSLVIQISRELCWENRIVVLFHELIEAAICIRNGITTEECDAFDDLFELEYEAGIWPKSVEAGFDKRCPYRKGHIWGSRFELLVMLLLRADRKKLNAECNKLMGVE